MLSTLVVDDSQRFRQCLRGLLCEAFPDMRIIEAADGQQLLEKIAEGRPHVVFMDIKLPGANGFRLTESLKSAYPEVFVVVMTSHDQPEYRDAAYAAGADHFFHKDEMGVPQIKGLLGSMAGSAGNGVPAA